MQLLRRREKHQALLQLVLRVLQGAQEGELLETRNLHSLDALLRYNKLLADLIAHFRLIDLHGLTVLLDDSGRLSRDRAEKIHVDLLFAVLNVVANPDHVLVHQVDQVVVVVECQNQMRPVDPSDLRVGLQVLLHRYVHKRFQVSHLPILVGHGVPLRSRPHKQFVHLSLEEAVLACLLAYFQVSVECLGLLVRSLVRFCLLVMHQGFKGRVWIIAYKLSVGVI